jgi:hypothetical protein
MTTPGTSVAFALAMAAVLALVFLPALAAAGFMILVVRDDLSLATAFAGIVFTTLAAGVFGGALRMARRWEGAHGTHD